MKFIFFDGSDSYDITGNEVTLNSLDKSDVVLMASSTFKAFNIIDEPSRDKYRESIGSKENSTLISDLGEYSTVFSIPFEQHKKIRSHCASIICEASYSVALANNITSSETLVSIFKLGEFIYATLWIEGQPLEESFIISSNLQATLDIYLETIMGHANTTQFRITSNLSEGLFTAFLESLDKHFEDSTVSNEYKDTDQLSKELLNTIQYSEYITQDELQARITQKNRQQRIFAFLISLALSLPGFTYAGYQYYQHITLSNQIEDAQVLNASLKSAVIEIQTLKGGAMYYNSPQTTNLKDLLLVLAKYPIKSGALKDQKTQFDYDLVSEEPLSDKMAVEPNLQVFKQDSFMKNKIIQYHLTGTRTPK